jgi:predicted RNase H-like HicB family nuclease
MRYTIIIERGPENYSAYAPTFPVALRWPPPSKTVALMKEALQLHIEDMRKRGEAIPNRAPCGKSKWRRKIIQ